MILYHGSLHTVKNPEVIKSEIGRDFGSGFYTTDIKEQAIRWALRRKKISNRSGEKAAKAFLNIYNFDDSALASLAFLNFPDPNLEWLELVLKCRSDVNFNHGCDIVSGKIANDSVGETVSYVQQGIMRKEDALNRLKFEQINSQICFCTDKALGFLKFVEAIEIEQGN